MEQRIGATNLRQQLADVLQAVQEQGVSYVIETFGRPQAILINLDEYRQYQRFCQERETFFDWLEQTAERHAERNVGLSDKHVLAIIERARERACEDVVSTAD